jgi:hypothetical protein
MPLAVTRFGEMPLAVTRFGEMPLAVTRASAELARPKPAIATATALASKEYFIVFLQS